MNRKAGKLVSAFSYQQNVAVMLLTNNEKMTKLKRSEDKIGSRFWRKMGDV
jgi:hypothetical protein